jgi:transglutaminase-like putative cysteine protease
MIASAARAYRVEHRTRYAYSAPVSLSRHIAHLEPRPTGWQKIRRYALHCDPSPEVLACGHDTFGNPTARLAIAVSHTELTVIGCTEVEVGERPWQDAALPGYRDGRTVAEGLRYRGGLPLAATQFRFESPYVRVKQELAQAGAPFLAAAGGSLPQACLALCEHIHREYRYEPAATAIDTPVLEVLRTRRGVCQDFAHLMISMLRSHGLAARYVSGYLLTEPAAGGERQRGVDASHAWVAVYCPPAGEGEGDWIEFDPTNGCLADARYIVLGWGRDFGDVSPLRGVILGGGTHRLSVAVTVEPLPAAGG